jgi:hypothetical protein
MILGDLLIASDFCACFGLVEQVREVDVFGFPMGVGVAYRR